jgi:pimeloyl-ACP methyl ester carboxylesterase
MTDQTASPYQPVRTAESVFYDVRGLRMHALRWSATVSAQSGLEPPAVPLVMVHGWADVGASFQFVVDAMLASEGPRRSIVAPDWRGFGLSSNGGSDAYWFADYLGDLDALIDQISPDSPVDLLGHSMGGNVVMSYAGVRPSRIRRLINLEGFGLPKTQAHDAPKRMAKWLDDLKTPLAFRDFSGVDAVAARLQANNPRLPADKAAWLASHWAAPDQQGRWQVLCDPAHKRVNPLLYRVDEILATWAAIQAPLLFVQGGDTQLSAWWQQRYTLDEFYERLTAVPQVRRDILNDCGHMLHHDDPAGLAALLIDFLSPT